MGNNLNQEKEKLVYCEKGHYYPAQEYDNCPFCFGESANQKIGVTMPVGEWEGDDDDNFDDGRTVPMFFQEKGIDPVVGWLVALNGSRKGADYHIHSDNNFIGRGTNMSICILGDETISKENHARVSYDTRTKKFYFTPGNGRNIVRVNNNAVFTTIELKASDILEIGMTKLIFMPLCNETFDWEKLVTQEGE